MKTVYMISIRYKDGRDKSFIMEHHPIFNFPSVNVTSVPHYPPSPPNQGVYIPPQPVYETKYDKADVDTMQSFVDINLTTHYVNVYEVLDITVEAFDEQS